MPSRRAWAAQVKRAQLLNPIIGFSPIGVLVFAATVSAVATGGATTVSAVAVRAAEASPASRRSSLMGAPERRRVCSKMLDK
ncbi:hypothetical protein Kpho02_37220 [Kitasatospora phosalacinea]|uniref:Uncharacterized protein n=1 Tax=Kitasatospora phosalacinea TaxID=2065 RepID=A0A9W6QAL1_9ACTN|nr:hypothetical protein Kpho02_37220 [Kitasatospora phosalacinea]